jgi:hypothetical protein
VPAVVLALQAAVEAQAQALSSARLQVLGQVAPAALERLEPAAEPEQVTEQLLARVAALAAWGQTEAAPVVLSARLAQAQVAAAQAQEPSVPVAALTIVP